MRLFLLSGGMANFNKYLDTGICIVRMVCIAGSSAEHYHYLISYWKATVLRTLLVRYYFAIEGSCVMVMMLLIYHVSMLL